MNQLLFLLGSGLLLTGAAHAQLGVRAGGGLGGITKSADEYSNATTAQRKLGYQLGVFYQVPLSKHVSLVPEAGFSYERFAVDKSYYGGEATFRSTYDQSLCYLNLPVMLRASLGHSMERPGRKPAC